ncbi:MAG: exonuclease domain-containing protein [Candidatus Omnitrophica bacterium]|nr:exonuclease domain-containing protein [Candidatus Omnitrophota bacterium]
MRIEDVEFTIFDTETTGLSPQGGDRIIEIAGIRFRGENKLSTFSTLINPGISIPKSAQAIHKITEEMLKLAPSPHQAIPKFLEFIQGSYLCAYNAGFDLSFLENELKILSITYPQELVFVDLFKMAKILLPSLESYSLKSVGESLGINFEELHRAERDCEIAYQIFVKLKEKLYQKNIFGIKDLISLFAINGKSLEDINQQKLIQIQEAINQNLRIKIKYLSIKDGNISEREVIPKELKYETKYIYFVGFCLLRNEERTFRIDGILQIQIL